MGNQTFALIANCYHCELFRTRIYKRKGGYNQEKYRLEICNEQKMSNQ